MTDHPRLEVPFDKVEKWEKIEGSCARLYAAAEWGYKKALKEQRSIAIRELAEPLSPGAQKVLEAYCAAAFRALAEQLRLELPLGDTDADAGVFAAHHAIYAAILAIATELDGYEK